MCLTRSAVVFTGYQSIGSDNQIINFLDPAAQTLSID